MSNIVNIVIAGFFVTSLAYLICFCCCIMQFFIRRNKERRRRHVAILTRVRNQENPPPTLQRNNTLKKRLIKQFNNQLKKLSSVGVSSSALSNPDISCPICFEEYSGDPAHIFVGYIKICQHYFHFDCIWTWLEDHPNCPLCREEVLLKEEDIKGISLADVATMQQGLHQNEIPNSRKQSDSSCSVINETEGSNTRPAELVLNVSNQDINRRNSSRVFSNISLPSPDMAQVHSSTDTPCSLGHLSVTHTPETPLEGTIASGVAFPGCGTHELDVRNYRPDLSGEEELEEYGF